jgi:hypothetical protein
MVNGGLVVLFLLFVLGLVAVLVTAVVRFYDVVAPDGRRGDGGCPHVQTYHPPKLYTFAGYGCDVPGCPGKWIDHG